QQSPHDLRLLSFPTRRSSDLELTGVTCQMMKDWVYFSATDVARFFGIEDQMEFPIIDENPLKYMENWLNMSKVQASNQEEDTARSEEHTSELQSRFDLVCRLL